MEETTNEVTASEEVAETQEDSVETVTETPAETVVETTETAEDNTTEVSTRTAGITYSVEYVLEDTNERVHREPKSAMVETSEEGSRLRSASDESSIATLGETAHTKLDLGAAVAKQRLSYAAQGVTDYESARSANYAEKTDFPPVLKQALYIKSYLFSEQDLVGYEVSNPHGGRVDYPLNFNEDKVIQKEAALWAAIPYDQRLRPNGTNIGGTTWGAGGAFEFLATEL